MTTYSYLFQNTNQYCNIKNYIKKNVSRWNETILCILTLTIFITVYEYVYNRNSLKAFFYCWLGCMASYSEFELQKYKKLNFILPKNAMPIDVTNTPYL